MSEFGDIKEILDGMTAYLKAKAKQDVELTKQIDNNFELLNQKIDNLNKRVTKLQHSTDKGFDAAEDSFADIKIHLVQINRATGYEGLEDNLTVVGDGKTGT